MVTTRSSTKRKSLDLELDPVEPQILPDSSKRKKLPLRKRTTKAAPKEIPDSDDGEAPAVEGEEGSDDEFDLDAALQEQVAAQNPDPPAVKRIDAQKPEAAAEEEEEEDSDDEAPEAVSNVQAASKAREAAEAMMKAAREYVYHPALTHVPPTWFQWFEF